MPEAAGAGGRSARAWLRGHWSVVASATSGALVVALVTTVAVVSGGYPAQRLDLGDAAVWISNTAQGFIGRVNTEVRELNSVVPVAGSDVEVVQRGATVLAVDRADATVGIVDAATSAVVESVPLPPAEPSVLLAGDNAVLYSGGTGELWVVPVATLADFDEQELQPTLSLAAGTVVSVDPDGLLFAFSPAAQRVYRVDAATSTSVAATEQTSLGGGTGEFAITSVAGRWAVLDVDSGLLETGGAVVDLAAAGTPLEAPVLQAASTEGDRVLVAGDDGLVAVPIDGGDPVVLAEGGETAGSPAAPVTVGGCSYAAWSGGQAWQQCGDSAAATSLLDRMPADATLGFRTNGARVVLNDTLGGAAWAVQSAGERIDNWTDLIAVEEDPQEVAEDDDSSPPELDPTQLPPVAVDDEFGVRPGTVTVLPVLLNDYDPNGDVVVVTGTTTIDPAVARVDLISNRQKLQVTLPSAATGSISFGYTIDDGRGGEASATVSLVVRAPGQNSPPEQVRSTRTSVAASGAATVDVLGDWIDPDGDPFYLADATVPAPLGVSFTPEGVVVVSGGGAPPGKNAVVLTVSDGSDEGTGSVEVTSVPTGGVPLTIDAFADLAYAGEAKTITPLVHVHGGNGAVRLNAVPAKVGSTVTPSYETGTFVFVSGDVGTHYLEVVVTDGEQTVTGQVRVDVIASPEANTRPITVPKTVFVPTLGSRTIDVAGTDIDPAGGVLLVTGIVNVPASSGVRAEVLEQRSVRVTLTGPLDQPVTFGYRITNGLAQSQGTVTVIEIDPPDEGQPPLARDDTATVRVGDAITIDVLANDEQPDGEPLSLDPVLVEGLTGPSGLLFASGDSLRYLAPAVAGNFSAVYQVTGALGQTSQARVSIEVREPTAETNNPPVPLTVTARVLAGERVSVEIPLDGIDPDGDSVQLLGQESSPTKGGVVGSGVSSIVYEAGEYSAGTDDFTYTVVDALGARATGSVRIGISPRVDGSRNPVAIEDAVGARPGATVSVQVLANDSDPDGSPLRIVSATSSAEGLSTEFDDGRILTITAPGEPGTYGIVYTIENESGGSSSNFVTLTVSVDAPLAFPVANDTVLTLADVQGRDTVDVDVLDSVFFADGPTSSLDLSIVPGYEGSASVTAERRIRVAVADDRQIIPFAVAHPDDPGVVSFAFIWVPGSGDALPQVDRDAPPLQVTSEETLTIELADYVIAVGGRKVRIADSNSVRATHADGAPLVVDEDTLVYTSADLYFGQASIAFEVTDGDSADDPDGNRANLVLPITVNPRENQPPVFVGATIDFEPEQSKVIDLRSLTTYPYAEDLDELSFELLQPAPAGFSLDLAAGQLTIRAGTDVVKGTTAVVGVGVRDAVGAGQSGRIQLQVVPSTRPLAIAAADSVITRRGTSTVVDVLANDEPANPFPGQPLRVVAVRGIDGTSLPAGVSVVASADQARLTISVAEDAPSFDTTVQYRVADATDDPDRYVWGSVRLSVQDVPDTPVPAVREGSGFVEGALVLRLTAPAANNSPITGYRVESSERGGYSYDCGTQLLCTLPGLKVGVPYQFIVIAVNDVGESVPSEPSDPYAVDYLPAAPVAAAAATDPEDAPAGGSITVVWDRVPDPDPGTAITGYVVEVAGQAPRELPATATSTVFTGLAPAATYGVTVYARNRAQVVTAADWRRSAERTVVAVGLPTAPSTPAVAANAADGSSAIEVTWAEFGSNGGSPVSYAIRRTEGAAAPADCAADPTASGVTSPWRDSATVDGRDYSYTVYAFNGFYCSAIATGLTESKVAPGRATGSAEVAFAGEGRYDVRAGSDAQFAVASGTALRYQYRVNGGQWADLTPGQWLTGQGDSSLYGVPTTVAFRGCRDEGEAYCGEASADRTLTPVTVRAGVAVCARGSVPVLVAPANVGEVAVSYAIAYELVADPLVPDVAEWSDYTYSPDDPVPSNAAMVRVKATVTVGPDAYTEADGGFGGDLPCS